MDIRNIKIISLAIVCLLSVNFVVALGVSSPYWKSNPLEMYAGETKEVEFSLVNKPDAEIEEAVVMMDESGGIATITSGEKYTVEPGTTSTKVIVKISVPEGVGIGQSYNVKFTVSSVPEEGGTVQLGLKYNVDFPVMVVEKPAEEVPEEPEGLSVRFIVGIVLAIVLVIILYLVLSKKKKK